MNDPFGAVAATPPGVADALNGFCQEDPPPGGHTLRGFDERIDALAAEQDRLVATGDRRGVFHLTYLSFSRQVRKGFDEGRFSDVAFAADMSCRFIDAYLLQARRWTQGDPTQCRAWARAFGGVQSGDANVLQSMFLGMNAHIHYDLAFVTLGSCRAAGDLDDLADTWRSVSRTGVPDVRHLDFLVINQIAWDAIPVIQDTVLGQFASVLKLGNKLVSRVTAAVGQRLLMDARDRAWAHATLLIHARTDLQRAAVAGMIDAYASVHADLVDVLSLKPWEIADGIADWAERGEEQEWAAAAALPDATRDHLVDMACTNPVVGRLALRELAFAGYDPGRVLQALLDADRDDLAADFVDVVQSESPRHRRADLRRWLDRSETPQLVVLEAVVEGRTAPSRDLPDRSMAALRQRWQARIDDAQRCLAVPEVAAVPELAAALRDHQRRTVELAGRVGWSPAPPGVAVPTAEQARSLLAAHPDVWVRTCATRMDRTTRDEAMDDLIDRVLFLRSTALFTEVATDDLLRVAEKLQARSYATGSAIVDAGVRSDGVHLIVDGQVEVSQTRRGGVVPLFSFGPGESVGELSALTDGPATSTCTARTDVRTWLLPTAVLAELLDRHPRVAVGLLRMISRRLVLTTQLVGGTDR